MKCDKHTGFIDVNNKGCGILVHFEKGDHISLSKFGNVIFWMGRHDNRPVDALCEDVQTAFELAKEDTRRGFLYDINVIDKMAEMLGGSLRMWEVCHVW